MAQATGRDPLKKQKDSLNFKNSTVQRLARGAGRYAADMLIGGPAFTGARAIARAYVASEGNPFGKSPRYKKGVCYRNCGEKKYVSSSGMTKEAYERKKKTGARGK